MDFTKKTVLITGAGAGIGRAAAILYAARGARVALNSLHQKTGEETLRLIQERGGQGIFIQGDVSKAADAEKIVQHSIETCGAIDILVNCAGIVIGGKIEDASEADYDRIMDVNVKGTFLMTKFAVHLMKSRGKGVIVNVSSILALKGVQDRSLYSASKGAIVSFTRALAADYMKDNIRVNAVCPGTTDTPSLDARLATFPDPAAARAAFISRQPMGRLGTAEEIAETILFASCDEAAFMTGSILTIDGGMSI
jgi:NAD(P)-dependent dehydrogenase (short-subunit alcohol dehydrogenase family)